MTGERRIRTTHTGSLPRPDDLAALLNQRDKGEAAPGIDERIEAAVVDIVEHQDALGVDVLNDGEMGKIGYAIYVKDRLTGFDGESEVPLNRSPEMTDHPDFAKGFMGSYPVSQTPACTGEIRSRGTDAVRRDIDNLKAAATAKGVSHEGRLFMTAASPGVISFYFANLHYGSREAFIGALADAMRDEYEAIAESGVTLQIDCPDLAMSRHVMFPDLTFAQFRHEIELNIEALNHAVARIPPEQMRMHVCWGNYDGPHTYDVPLEEIVDVVLRARPAGLSIEACNPRHQHEWQVWEDVKLPDGKYLIPGVVDTTNNFVEHPKVVMQRLLNYARVVGPDVLMAGSDCGFSTRATARIIAPSVSWAKLRSLSEGAQLASRALSA
jgi:5-methyltetrahydropteroyltriglutamate--homocysteine methyltransferase